MLSGHDYYWQDIPEFDEPEEGGDPVAKEHWKNDWQCLGEFEIVKPDVPEGANQQEIFLAACGAGFSFDFPIDTDSLYTVCRTPYVERGRFTPRYISSAGLERLFHAVRAQHVR